MKNISLFILGFAMIVACSKGDTTPDPILTIDKSSATLHSKETTQIVVNSNSGNTIVYESSNIYVAKVDNSGLITAGVIGSAGITVKDGILSKTCKVIVSPRCLSIIEPVLTFGSNMAQVKSGDTFPIKEESLNQLACYSTSKSNTSSLLLHLYIFKNDKLESSAVEFSLLNSICVNNLVDFLEERYLPVRQVSSTEYYFGSSDLKTLVGVMLMPTYVIIMYTQVTSTSSIKPGSFDFNQIKMNLK